MNIAIIFAGGTGQRMNSKSVPKQFLEIEGKPIIVHTLEHFERHNMIDGIIIVCVEEWIKHLEGLLTKFGFCKVEAIVPGGSTGFLSRCNGVKKAAEMYNSDTICLMHDGVRPIVDSETIAKNILSVQKYGSAVTVSPAVETIAVIQEGNRVGSIIDRSKCQIAKAPQSFRLGQLTKAHEDALAAGMEDCIDTAYLMQMKGCDIFTVEGPADNLKITKPADFYTFTAILDMRKRSQVFGI